MYGVIGTSAVSAERDAEPWRRKAGKEKQEKSVYPLAALFFASPDILKSHLTVFKLHALESPNGRLQYGCRTAPGH